jgi:hypothetical protein
MKKISAILLICTLGISLLVGCKKAVTTPLPAASSSEVSSSNSAPTVIDVSAITLNQTAIILEVGKTQQLTATVAPDGATNQTVKLLRRVTLQLPRWTLQGL